MALNHGEGRMVAAGICEAKIGHLTGAEFDHLLPALRVLKLNFIGAVDIRYNRALDSQGYNERCSVVEPA